MTAFSDDRLALGRFGRPHALKGEIRLFADARLSEVVAPGLLCHVPVVRGNPMPMRLTSVRASAIRRRAHHGTEVATSGESRLFFVTLDRVTTREEADALHGLEVTVARTPEIEALLSDQPSGATLPIGYLVLDEGVPFGHVEQVIENPAHPLLSVTLLQGDDEAETGQEILIPFTEPFIIEIDETERNVHGRDLEMFREAGR